MSVSTQTLLETITIYLICSFVARKTIRPIDFKWISLCLFFFFVSRINFVASDSANVDFVGLDIYKYEILPVDTWFLFLFLFIIVLILNSVFFNVSRMEAVHVTILGFIVWIIVRICSVIFVGVFTEQVSPVIDRVVTLGVVFALLLFPIQSLSKAIDGSRFFSKIMVWNSFAILLFLLIMTNFNSVVVIEYAWMILSLVFSIVTVNIWMVYRENKKIIQESRINVIEQYMPVIDDLVAEMRAKQHEFSNKILAISSIVETEDDIMKVREKIREYTSFAVKDMTVQPLLHVENKVIAGFLYSKMKLAQWKRIKLITYVSTDFTSFQTNEYVWIEIVGILVDNAIEASYPGETIQVSFVERDNQLKISVSNPSEYVTNSKFSAMFEQGFTTKTEKTTNRGYGLVALKLLTDQYSGTIKMKNEDNKGRNYITITVTLP
ncbi:sensor histidine kinase [Alkalihalobacterium bogoriense]|uniref:sensor histidine kinase n=1 Tax=Alkalihalobacterium bogoriense TaxID=246272 RepID=UPI00146FA52E|nr:GHKL domain-containing protein [Alkalihalobacterium bogoriense]